MAKHVDFFIPLIGCLDVGILPSLSLEPLRKDFGLEVTFEKRSYLLVRNQKVV